MTRVRSKQGRKGILGHKEDRLKDIIKTLRESLSTPTAKKKTLRRSWVKLVVLGITVAVALTIGLKVFGAVTYQPYQAGVVLRIEPRDFKTDRVNVSVVIENEVRAAQSKEIRSVFLKQTLPWPSFMTGQTWLISWVGLFLDSGYDVKKGDLPNTVVVTARAKTKDAARQRVKMVFRLYQDSYVARRQHQLIKARQQVNQAIQEHQTRLVSLMTQVNQTSVERQFWVVSQAAKKKIDGYLKSKSLDIEKDINRIEEQSQRLRKWLSQGQQNKAYLKALQLQLTSMDMESFVGADDPRASKDQGIKDVKRRIAAAIHERAQEEGLSQGQENVWIKAVFVEAQAEAIKALSQHRFATGDTLPEQGKMFARLKSDMDQASAGLEDLWRVGHLMDEALAQPLQGDVVTDSPIVVVKK